MRTTILDLQKMKKLGQRIPMVTAYDATGAHWVEAAGVPAILVGDSLGMVVQGHDTTLPVTFDEMVYHTKMVVRGTSKSMIIGDLPFLSYQVSIEDAIRNAGRLLKEGGAGAVKLEGGAHMAETIHRLTQIGIPVMAHIGLTPQSVNALGGFRVQGKDEQSAIRLIDDALQLQEAGAFAIILETIPAPLAVRITERLRIPTIGIGAGPGCDGQIQVFHDMLGLIEGFTPRHAKHYAEIGREMEEAIQRYMAEVQAGEFPDPAHSFGMTEAVNGATVGVYGSK
jgi:3-methyl-2-oxobutanoate hydroxymethyltransferase